VYSILQLTNIMSFCVSVCFARNPPHVADSEDSFTENGLQSVEAFTDTRQYMADCCKPL